jgi:beta-galactosidase
VSLRAQRASGKVTVRAKSGNLRSAAITVDVKPFEVANGISKSMPVLPDYALPANPPPTVLGAAAADAHPAARRGPAQVTALVKTFSYSGPTTIVHVEQKARKGRNAYVDRDLPFDDLPAPLEGADWVQGAASDSLYNAVDLMEMAVKAGSVVSVAHDDRLPRPAWLQQFKATELSITIAGQPMKVFQREVPRDESITFGANTDDNAAKVANMYVVFISPAKKS